MTKSRRTGDDLFLRPSEHSLAAYRGAIEAAAGHVASTFKAMDRVVSGADYEKLCRSIKKLDVCPERGIGLEAALAEVGEKVLPHVVAISDPKFVAYYHSAPMLPSLAAEVMISATNQSLDSFDASPSATVVEMHVVRWLCSLMGFGPGSDGAITSGGTQSNLMGLMLARDAFGWSRDPAWDIMEDGLPPDARDWCILTSDLAHFSVEKSAHILGFGNRSVVSIQPSRAGSITAAGLLRSIKAERLRGRQPFALALTAGTTDLGSIDQIEECAMIARSEGIWTHLDAAAGGGLLLSERHRKLLRGIELVDSVSIDFHKWFYQAISCGFFAVRDKAAMSPFLRDIPYLDPSDRADTTPPNLIRNTIQTTRRFDALKVLVSMRTLGQKAFARLIDQTMRTTQEAGRLIRESADFILMARPSTNVVLFRWQPEGWTDEADVDALNDAIQSRLWKEGSAILGRTVYRGSVALKMTLLNPLTTPETIKELLQAIQAAGETAAVELTSRRAMERLSA